MYYVLCTMYYVLVVVLNSMSRTIIYSLSCCYVVSVEMCLLTCRTLFLQHLLRLRKLMRNIHFIFQGHLILYTITTFSISKLKIVCVMSRYKIARFVSTMNSFHYSYGNNENVSKGNDYVTSHFFAPHSFYCKYFWYYIDLHTSAEICVSEYVVVRNCLILIKLICVAAWHKGP